MLAIIICFEQGQLFSQNKNGHIKCWQVDGFELTLLGEIESNTFGYCSMVLYQTNRLLCSGQRSSVNVYSTENFKKRIIWNPGTFSELGELMIIKCIQNYVFFGYESNTICLWNGQGTVSQYNFPELEGLLALDVDHTMAKGVCAGTTDKINTFHIIKDKFVFDKSIKITNPGVSGLKLRPDNKIVAAACWDHKVKLFSWKSMKLLAVLDPHSTGVISLVYSERSIQFWKTKHMLAVADKGNRITLWDVYNEENKNE